MPTPGGVAAAVASVSGALPADDYYFRVTASDGIGWTKASVQLLFDLTDTNYGIRVSWNPVLGATKYRVYRALTAAGAYKYIETTNTYYNYINDSAFTLTAPPPEESTAYINKLSAAGNSWFLGGNLGIGTANPVVPLQIKRGGVIYLHGSPGARVYFFNDETPDWCLGTQTGEETQNFNLHNYGLGTTALSVNRASNFIGIGTASPTYHLHVNGNVKVWNIWWDSSKRRKTNIKTLDGALGKIQRLRGVSYHSEITSKHEIGLVAEEVGEVIPEAVDYEENGKDARGLDYSRLVAVLIEAVKEQQTQIETLKAEVQNLAKRIK